MKKVLRLLGLFLLILVIASFVGCQKSNNINNKDKGNVQEQSNKLNKNMPEKLANNNITIVYNNVQQEGIVDSVFETIKVFENKYGGKVEVINVPYGEIPTMIYNMVAAGNPPDTFPAEDIRYILKGVLQPIDPHVDWNDPLWTANGADFLDFEYKGQHYGVPSLPNPFVIIYNQTLFENNGLKTPIEYYKEGKWDWSVLKELGMKLTQDTDQDGTIDQWGFYGAGNKFIYLSGGKIFDIQDDGLPKLTVTDPIFIEGLQFLQDAVLKDKYMSSQTDWRTNMEKFKQGQTGMIFERYWMLKNFKDEGIKIECAMVPPPKRVNEGNLPYPAGFATWGIPKGAKNPEGAAAFLYLKKKVEDELDKDKEYYTKEQLEMINEIRKNAVDITSVSVFGDLQKNFDKAFRQILQKGTPPTTAIESNLSAMQAELDVVIKDMK